MEQTAEASSRVEAALLFVQDSQIRALLGEQPLTRVEIKSRAAQVVDRFFGLSARDLGVR